MEILAHTTLTTIEVITICWDSLALEGFATYVYDNGMDMQERVLMPWHTESYSTEKEAREGHERKVRHLRG